MDLHRYDRGLNEYQILLFLGPLMAILYLQQNMPKTLLLTGAILGLLVTIGLRYPASRPQNYGDSSV